MKILLKSPNGKHENNHFQARKTKRLRLRPFTNMYVRTWSTQLQPSRALEFKVALRFVLVKIGGLKRGQEFVFFRLERGDEGPFGRANGGLLEGSNFWAAVFGGSGGKRVKGAKLDAADSRYIRTFEFGPPYKLLVGFRN